MLLHPRSRVEGLRLECQAPRGPPHVHRAQHCHLLLTILRLLATEPFRVSLDSVSLFENKRLLTALLLLVNWQQAELTLRPRQVAVAVL